MPEDKIGDEARLRHILDAIQEILGYTKDANFDLFSKNSMMNQASIRQLEIIGEAATRISSEVKEKHDAIEWRQIIALRNLLIHQYFGVDVRLVWDIVQTNLIPLSTQITAILDEEY